MTKKCQIDKCSLHLLISFISTVPTAFHKTWGDRPAISALPRKEYYIYKMVLLLENILFQAYRPQKDTHALERETGRLPSLSPLSSHTQISIRSAKLSQKKKSFSFYKTCTSNSQTTKRNEKHNIPNGNNTFNSCLAI